MLGYMTYMKYDSETMGSWMTGWPITSVSKLIEPVVQLSSGGYPNKYETTVEAVQDFLMSDKTDKVCANDLAHGPLDAETLLDNLKDIPKGGMVFLEEWDQS